MIFEEGLTFDDVLLLPRAGVLEKREMADISSEVVPGKKVDIPILSANMPSVTGIEMTKAMSLAGGLGVLHRFNSIEEAGLDYLSCSGYSKGVSLGLKDGLDRAQHILKVGNPIFFLDVAHGHHYQVARFVGSFRSQFGDEPKLVVGNFATQEGVYDLLDMHLKVDGIKVGVGPGAACTTREVTGFGVPQLTAIMEAREVLDQFKRLQAPTLIADGGIKNSGDIVKALAAGADTVMIGRLLAGCDEAPQPGVYYGNASKHVNNHHAPEGVHGKVERTGSVKDVLKRLSWGIRSGISYGGATNLQELRENARWLRVSPHTAMESGIRL